MGDDITIGVTEIVNNIEVTAQPNDQIVDISVIDNTDEVTLNITPTVIEINVNKGSSYAKWGTILGTLSDQEDLQDALDLKANLVDGKVPASELPSYVDDVIEVADYASLPVTGEIGKIYITLDDNKIYRWSGSIYIEIASNNAIWGAITGTLSNQLDLQAALDAKQSTLVSGTNIKTLEGQSLLGSGNIDLTKSDVGLSNVDNTSDLDKPISTATQAALDLKADDNEVVKLTTDQSIAGVKTFTNLSKFTNNTGSFAVEIDTTSSDALVVKDTGTTKLQIGKNGEILAAKYKISGGFNTQFLKANGDLDSTIYTPASRTLTINGTSYDLSANRSWTIATHDSVTIGTANGLSLSGQELSLALASGSTTGALSSTDWNTFNNKLSSLSGAVLTTTDQSITGTKTFNVSTLTDAILVNNSGGRAIRINNYTAGFGLLINNATLSSAIPLVIQKNGTTNFSVSDIGHISTASIAATTIVKSGGTAVQILAADGTVITAGTNITISGGTISASGGLSGSGTTNFLPKFTGSSALGNSQIFDNGSSVMIGTSGTSSAKLSVSHDAENLGAIFTSNTNTSNYVDQISINYRGVGKMISCRGATTAEVFNVSNVGGAYFAGDVGIGTTNPAERLSIVGSTDYRTIFLERNLTANTAQRTGIVCKTYSGNNNFGLIGGGDINGTNATVLIGYTGTVAANEIILYTAPAYNGAQIERMRITSDGLLVKYGDSSSARIIPATDNVGYIGQNTRRWQAIYAVNGTIQTSDGREKTDILDSDLGLDFINKLRPVSYKWIVGENIVTEKKVTDENGEIKNETIVTPRAGVRSHYGFIAQEIEETLNGKDFGGFIYDEETDKYSLRYAEFISPIIKAMQELSEQVKELKAEIELLKAK